MNQRVQTRMGNRHPSMAPHGCYRCSGDDKWVAIAVSSDEEWQALCQAMGNPAWAGDEKFADALSRWKNQDELDRLIEEWTATQDYYEVMRVLQAAGVAAGAVLNSKEQALDPHLRERDYYWIHKHPEVGTRAFPGPWGKLSTTPGIMRMPPPTLGQHNEQVLSKLLGMSKKEIAELASEGIIGTRPVGAAELPPSYMPVVPIPIAMAIGALSEYDENYREILGLPED
jgi:benzylsuccinate CoA-transferase BbsF subunit